MKNRLIITIAAFTGEDKVNPFSSIRCSPLCSVLITPVGLKANLYSGTIQRVVTADRLFAPESYC